MFALDQIVITHTLCFQPLGPADKAQTPFKRGRGRPRKDTTAGQGQTEQEITENIKATIAGLSHSAQTSLLADIFGRQSVEAQANILQELLNLHIMDDPIAAKYIPSDFIDHALKAMLKLGAGRVDNVLYYLCKALSTNTLDIKTASFALIQVTSFSQLTWVFVVRIVVYYYLFYSWK